MIAPIQVSEGIWRGPQPSGADWAMLKDLGIRTVLKLNYEDESSDYGALDTGLTLMRLPMPPKDFIGALGKPDPVDVAHAVSDLCDSTLYPLYVHCLHGHDRTGIVVGEYRVLHEGWRCRAAFDEMCRLGFDATLPDLLLTWSLFCMERH